MAMSSKSTIGLIVAVLVLAALAWGFKSCPYLSALLKGPEAATPVAATTDGNSSSESSPEGAVIKLDDSNLEQNIKEGVVLVDFWATWCPPCRSQAPILDEVAAELGQRAVIAKVDVDQNKDSASKYGIRSLPTLVIFKDGEEVQRLVGMQRKPALLTAIESHL